jgi:hypothetical protein
MISFEMEKPPFVRFISIQSFHAGIYKSGTPALTPSTFSRVAVAMFRAPPFGIAKIRTPAKVWRNHLTSSRCSS